MLMWKTTSDPFLNDFRVLSRQVDEMFRDMFPAPKARATRRDFTIDENDESVTLRAAFPGMSSEDLSLEVEDGKLKLAARRSSEVPEGYRAIRRERGELALERAFTLGNKIDAEAIEASFENGILTVTLPKRAEEKPRRIAISAA